MRPHTTVSIWTSRRLPGLRGPLSILLIDDYEQGSQAVAAALSVDGHQVRTASNGGEAVEALRVWTPDAAILDINMPSPDGFELAMALRRRPDTRDIYIIALTSMEERHVRRAGMRAGFDAFCRKGAGAAPLLDIILFFQAADG